MDTGHVTTVLRRMRVEADGIFRGLQKGRCPSKIPSNNPFLWNIAEYALRISSSAFIQVLKAKSPWRLSFIRDNITHLTLQLYFIIRRQAQQQGFSMDSINRRIVERGSYSLASDLFRRNILSLSDMTYVNARYGKIHSVLTQSGSLCVPEILKAVVQYTPSDKLMNVLQTNMAVFLRNPLYWNDGDSRWSVDPDFLRYVFRYGREEIFFALTKRHICEIFGSHLSEAAQSSSHLLVKYLLEKNVCTQHQIEDAIRIAIRRPNENQCMETITFLIHALEDLTDETRYMIFDEALKRDHTDVFMHICSLCKINIDLQVILKAMYGNAPNIFRHIYCKVEIPQEILQNAVDSRNICGQTMYYILRIFMSIQPKIDSSNAPLLEYTDDPSDVLTNILELYHIDPRVRISILCTLAKRIGGPTMLYMKRIFGEKYFVSL
jgi:hypothetical protein